MTITQNLAQASEYNRAIALIVQEEQHSISVSGGVESSDTHLKRSKVCAQPSEIGTEGSNKAHRMLSLVSKSASGSMPEHFLAGVARYDRPDRSHSRVATGPLTDSHSHGILLLLILFAIGTLMLFGVMVWRSLPVIWRWL